MNFFRTLFLFAGFSGLAFALEVGPEPIGVAMNPNESPSLVNSVDFHPEKNLFCVTYTHNNEIVVYELEGLSIRQRLKSPGNPQHAVFSKDGKSLVATNWTDETFGIYRADQDGYFQEAEVVPYPEELKSFKPHGMAFSPDGSLLAAAYGAFFRNPRGIALFRFDGFELLHLLQTKDIEKGIPKGVAFTPDGSSLVVTFEHTNSAAIYTVDWENGRIDPEPVQILSGKKAKISRPEDIKFTVDGQYFAISNSNRDMVAFYEFDPAANAFAGDEPVFILKNQLSFPHGLAFSPDGMYLTITQFGKVTFNKSGKITSWGQERGDRVSVYRISD